MYSLVNDKLLQESNDGLSPSLIVYYFTRLRTPKMDAL